MNAAATLITIPTQPLPLLTLSILAFLLLIYPPPIQSMVRKLCSMLANALLCIAGAVEWLGMLLKSAETRDTGGSEGVRKDEWRNMNMRELRAMHAAREREVREESERRRERVEAVKQRERERTEAGRRAMHLMMAGGEQGKAAVQEWTEVWGRGERG